MSPGRPCKVCQSDHRSAVDAALTAGQTDPAVAAQFGLHVSSVRRHRQSHVAARLAVAVKEREAELRNEGRKLLDRVERHVDRLERLADAADRRNEQPEGKVLAEILAVSRELTGVLTLFGKVTGEIQTGTQINVAVNSLLVRFGVESESEIEAAVKVSQMIESMPIVERLRRCEEFVLTMYRDHPEIERHAFRLMGHTIAGREFEVLVVPPSELAALEAANQAAAQEEER